MSKIIFAVLVGLSLTGCKEDGSAAKVSGDTTTYMLNIHQCTEIPAAGNIWAMYLSSYDTIALYLTQADCLGNVNYDMTNILTSIVENNVPTGVPNAPGWLDYDGSISTATQFALVYHETW